MKAKGYAQSFNLYADLQNDPMNFTDLTRMELQNKNGSIFGVANKRSIAWATAQALGEVGAGLAFTHDLRPYQGGHLKQEEGRL